ncbi:TorF family putative porin [Sphingomonas sp. C3-2]|uniref:TorF family putative porin n=1 Tax=Sphingomonas sp. C3-2 TaxID=3062169 RepID=UPI00294B2F87|nr:TorF family putative porin [Sphingomonas sp. C3-2]WOK35205.1 TorF family putative porin [Sphingomonas sp. C3-2]
MRFVTSSGLALIAFLLPVAAAAETAADTPEFTVSGAATIVSDYRFRGVSLTGKDPAVQATINLAHESGVYIGAWGSSIDMGDRYGATEIDFYAGWAGSIAPRTDLDMAVAYYSYPGGSGPGKIEFFETSAKLSHDLGPLRTTLGMNYSWDQAALGDDNLYLYGEAAASIPGTPLTLKARGGRTRGALSPRAGSYHDWSLGADAGFGPITVGLAYVDTDLGRGARADGAALLSISAAF